MYAYFTNAKQKKSSKGVDFTHKITLKNIIKNYNLKIFFFFLFVLFN
jgi:hypothetical protein